MIQISYNHKTLRVDRKKVVKIVNTVFKGEGKKVPSISIVFTNNIFIKKINKEFLGHNYVTDVISFYLGDDSGVSAEFYINLDAAKKQAKEYGVTFTEESYRLVIHACLHIIGYKDSTETLRRKMSCLENKYLDKIFLGEK